MLVKNQLSVFELPEIDRAAAVQVPEIRLELLGGEFRN